MKFTVHYIAAGTTREQKTIDGKDPSKIREEFREKGYLILKIKKVK